MERNEPGMPLFIFADHIKDLIAAGRKELAVPPGARISQAAWDLIKAAGMEVRFIEPAAPAEPLAEAEAALPEAELSEEDLELIVRRVLEKLARVKGRPETETAAGPGPEAADEDDLIICRCEEITRGEIKAAIRAGLTTLNGIKRVTRAGMGLCQGQTCQRLTAQILAAELNLSPGDLAPATARPPVRPVPISVLATG